MSLVGLLVAGGRGRRMAADRPGVKKPLVTVGGMSLIGRNLRALCQAGVDAVWVSARRGDEEIERHLRSTVDARIGALHFVWERQPLGTAGALGCIDCDEHPVLAVNADLVSGIDLRGLVATHRRRGADLTLATHEERHRLRLGEVVADADGVVTAYHEKPEKRYVIGSGTYVVGARARRCMDAEERVDLPELVHRALAAGLVVVEERHRAPWVDVNDESDRVHADALARSRPELAVDVGRAMGARG